MKIPQISQGSHNNPKESLKYHKNPPRIPKTLPESQNSNEFEWIYKIIIDIFNNSQKSPKNPESITLFNFESKPEWTATKIIGLCKSMQICRSRQVGSGNRFRYFLTIFTQKFQLEISRKKIHGPSLFE